MQSIDELLDSLSKKYPGIALRECVLASGRKAIIREQNGEDDGILTNPIFVKSNNNYNAFLGNIVLALLNEDDSILKEQVTMTDIKNMAINDKYSVLIHSRIFSLGEALQFEYPWDDKEEPTIYTENLEFFLNNIKAGKNLLPGEEGYFKYAIPLYTEDITQPIELTLQSNKRVRFTILDGHGECYLLELNEDRQNINALLTSRNLEILITDEWHRVDNFKLFSARDMMELRSAVITKDPRFDGMTEVIHPDNKNRRLELPLVEIPDFLFPRTVQ